jgi:hypothetical protein
MILVLTPECGGLRVSGPVEASMETGLWRAAACVCGLVPGAGTGNLRCMRSVVLHVSMLLVRSAQKICTPYLYSGVITKVESSAQIPRSLHISKPPWCVTRPYELINRNVSGRSGARQ